MTKRSPACPLTILVPGKLADLEFVGAKIDEQAVLYPRSLEVTENLRLMLVAECPNGFRFHDEIVAHEQVSVKVA
jgi:hypothetical protein